MKCKIILAFLLFVIIISCSKEQKNIKNLKIISVIDCLKDSYGNEVFIDDISEILRYGKDSLLIVTNRDRNIFITNYDFKILKTISLKDKAYLFEGNIFSATLKNKLLYLVDNSFYNIKILNMLNDSVLVLHYQTANKFPSAIQNIISVNDSIFLASYSQFIIGKSECIIGAIYNTNGEIIKNISAPTAKFGYNDYTINGGSDNEVFVSMNKTKVYFSFETTRTVFEYDFSGEIINTYKLDVDNRFYLEPHRDKVGNYKDPITGHALEIVDDKIYYVLQRGAEASPTIIEYSLKFDKKTEYVFDQDIIRGWRYLLKRIDNRFIIKDIPGSLFYVAEIQ